jgi:1,2-diacylglycerol 3-beta-galactosyltransferase
MPPDKQILILTSDAGYGHRSTANAIASAMKLLHPQGVQTNIVNPHDDSRIPELIRKSQANYDNIVRNNPELHEVSYTATENPIAGGIYSGMMATLLAPVMKDLLEKYQPDVIISTYMIYQAPLELAFKHANHRPPLLTVVTDLENVHHLWFHPAADFCLVPNQEVEQQALSSGLPRAKVIVTGIPVNPEITSHAASTEQARAALGWNATAFTALVLGSKRVRGLLPVIESIDQSDLHVQLAVLCGGDEQLLDDLQARQWQRPIHLYGLEKDVSPFLTACDAVISKAGGLVVSEALATGKPILLMDALPGQEIGNRDYVCRHNAGEWAESPQDAVRILSRWSDPMLPDYTKIAANARSIGYPESARQVASIAWNLAGDRAFDR